MAAASLAQAALAETEAALAEAVLARERARMAAEDSEAFIAQRYFYRSLQLPLPDPFFERFFSWRRAYNSCHNNWLAALDAMRAARTANRAGDARGVHEALMQELGSDSEDDAEEDLLNTLRQAANAAPTQRPAMFTGPVQRLG